MEQQYACALRLRGDDALWLTARDSIGSPTAEVRRAIMMKTFMAATTAAVVAGAVALAGPAVAVERHLPSTAVAEHAPAYDPRVAPPSSGDLTWAQVEEVITSSPSYRDPATQASARVDAVSSGAGCTINTGDVYKRASGRGFPYGTVGGKPTTTCGTLMVRMTQTTTLYKTVWWGLQKVAGPFTSSNVGQGTITQRNVIRKCDDLRDTTFRMIVRNTGTFPTGSTGTASAYEESTEACGTN
jgi:hypothetical protein